MNLVPLQAPVCTLAITLPEYTGEHRVAVKKETKPFEPLEKRYGAALDSPLPDSIHPNVLKVYSFPSHYSSLNLSFIAGSGWRLAEIGSSS